MKHSMFRSTGRVVATFIGSYLGARAMGWLYDNVITKK